MNLNFFYESPAHMVRDYTTTAGQTPDVSRAQALIAEEYEEWKAEGVLTEGDLKELADLVYVIYGYANTLGYDLDEAVSRVHKNNMGRMYQEDGTIKRREDGKIMKNPDFPKVDLKDLV